MAAAAGVQLQGPKERIYELQQRLGGGQFAGTWRAEDECGAVYAIKIFEVRRALLTDEDLRRAHAREAAVLNDIRSLRCPHLVEVDECFMDEASGLYCIVMTLVEGPSLTQRMRSPYTIADVWRWLRQLATALDCLASLREPVVHGDIKPDNLQVSAATGDLVLVDLGGCMWQRGRGGLCLSLYMPPISAFAAPEMRPSLIGPGFGLSEDQRQELVNEMLTQMGGGRLDVWALGVVGYLLALHKDPEGYDDGREGKMQEVDDVAGRADEWLQAQLLMVWPDEDAGQLGVLAKVIAGAMRRDLDGRLKASEVLEMLPPAGAKQAVARLPPEELRAWYKQQLARRLESRPCLLESDNDDDRVSLLEDDVVPLDLLPNEAFIDALTRPASSSPSREQQQQQPRPVQLSQLLSGEVCGKGLSVIVGPPGAGKTTLLHHLALRMAGSEAAGGDGREVPVVVHAQSLLENLPTGADLGQAEALLTAVEVAVDASLKFDDYTGSLQAMARQARDGQEGRRAVLALLVDGLDEVADRDKLLQRLLHVQAGGASSPFRRVIVCSRPGAFEGLTLDRRCLEAVLRVLPLDEQRSEGLVQRLLARPGWDAQDAALMDQVRELARSTFQGSPLLLYLLCYLAREQGAVSDSRVGLFEQMLSLCLQRAERRARGTGGRLQWDDDRLLDMCGLVAYLIHRLGWQARSEVVMRRELEEALSQVLRSEAAQPWAADVFGERWTVKRAVAEALEGFSGLLCQHGRLGYRMLHRNLQEYLAARFLAQPTTDPLLLRVRRHVCGGGGGGPEGGGATAAAWIFEWWDEAFITSDWWDEVYGFAGLLRGPTWLAERLLQLPEGGGEVDRPGSVKAWLRGIAGRGLDSGDVGLRRLRHVLRACCGGGSNLPGLDDVETTRLAGQAVVGGFRRQHYLVLSMVFNDSYLTPREWSRMSADVVAPVCEELLLLCNRRCLVSDYGRDVEGGRAAEALGVMGAAAASQPGVVEALLGLLGREDSWARLCATQALSKMGEAAARRPGVVEALVGLLGSADSELVWRATDVLGEMGEAAASRPGVVEALVGLLGHTHPAMVCEAARALVKMRQEAVSRLEVVEVLVDRLGHTHSLVAVRAAEALHWMAEEVASRPGVVEALVGQLGHADSDVAGRACDMLRFMGEAAASRPGVVEALVGLLSHADSKLTCRAAEALGWMGEAAASRPGVMKALVGLVGNADSGAGDYAAQALGRMSEAAASRPGVVEALVGLLGHADSRRAGQAAAVLGAIGQAAASRPGVVEALVGMLGHADGELASHAATALGEMGEAAASRPGVVNALVGMLGHADKPLPGFAAEALGKMGEAAGSKPGVVEGLVALLDQCPAGSSVAYWAPEALSHMGKAAASNPTAMEVLVGLLRHAESKVACRAADALGWMGEAAGSSPGVVEALVSLLGRADSNVASCVTRALGGMAKAAASRPGVVEALVGSADLPIQEMPAYALQSLSVKGTCLLRVRPPAGRALWRRWLARLMCRCKICYSLCSSVA